MLSCVKMFVVEQVQDRCFGNSHHDSSNTDPYVPNDVQLFLKEVLYCRVAVLQTQKTFFLTAQQTKCGIV